MKKSKLFILLPLVTLCLSSCDAIFGSISSGSSSASSEVSESTSYDSYSLDFTFLYRGNVETVSSDASLYFYSNLTDNSFKALNANGDTYRLTLENVAYGSYTYAIYIEYLDSSVSSASPLVDAGQITVDSSASSYSKQVNLNSPLAEILGEKSEDEKTDYTYTIEVNNANALTALTYDGNSATQTSVELEIYLVTTLDNGNQERTKAEVGDVSLSNYSESVITIDGLTVTPVNAGSTSITISREGYISTSVNVIVSDITDTGESGGSGDSGTGGDSGESGGSGGTGGDLNSDGTASITLNITIYASDGVTSLKVPDDCVVYIAGDFDVHDDSDDYWWNLDSSSAITLTSSDNGIYLYTYETTVTPGQSNYHFKLLLVENGTEYDWYTYTIYDSYFDAPADIGNGGSITLQCITTYTSDLSEAFGEEEKEGGDDNPNTGEVVTAINNYTIVFTIYDTYGLVQECPSYGSLYLHGNFGGDLITPNDGNPYYEWTNDYIKLTETTYESHVAYYATFNGVIPGETYAFDVCFVYDDEDASTWRPINDANQWNSYDFYCTIETGAIDNGTQYQNLENCYTLSSEFADKTILDSYKLVFTIYDTNGEVQSCPSWGKLQITGDFDPVWNAEGSYYEWGPNHDLTATTDQSNNTAYEVEFSGLKVGETYNFNIVFIYDDDSYDNSWNAISENNFTVTITGESTGVQYADLTGCYTLESQYALNTGTGDEGGNTGDTGEKYEGQVNLYFLVVDTTSATSTSNFTTCYGFNQSGITEQYKGIFTGRSDGWYNYSDATLTTGTVNGETHVAAYNSTIGIANTDDEISIEIKNWSNSDNAWQTYGFDVKVPMDCGNTITCVVYADLSVFKSSLTDDVDQLYTYFSEVYYYAGTPTSIFSAGLTH